jgi:hypothetical protein
MMMLTNRQFSALAAYNNYNNNVNGNDQTQDASDDDDSFYEPNPVAINVILDNTSGDNLPGNDHQLSNTHYSSTTVQQNQMELKYSDINHSNSINNNNNNNSNTNQSLEQQPWFAQAVTTATMIANNYSSTQIPSYDYPYQPIYYHNSTNNNNNNFDNISNNNTSNNNNNDDNVNDTTNDTTKKRRRRKRAPRQSSSSSKEATAEEEMETGNAEEQFNNVTDGVTTTTHNNRKTSNKVRRTTKKRGVVGTAVNRDAPDDDPNDSDYVPSARSVAARHTSEDEEDDYDNNDNYNNREVDEDLNTAVVLYTNNNNNVNKRNYFSRKGRQGTKSSSSSSLYPEPVLSDEYDPYRDYDANLSDFKHPFGTLIDPTTGASSFFTYYPLLVRTVRHAATTEKSMYYHSYSTVLSVKLTEAGDQSTVKFQNSGIRTMFIGGEYRLPKFISNKSANLSLKQAEKEWLFTTWLLLHRNPFAKCEINHTLDRGYSVELVSLKGGSLTADRYPLDVQSQRSLDNHLPYFDGSFATPITFFYNYSATKGNQAKTVLPCKEGVNGPRFTSLLGWQFQNNKPQEGPNPLNPVALIDWFAGSELDPMFEPKNPYLLNSAIEMFTNTYHYESESDLPFVNLIALSNEELADKLCNSPAALNSLSLMVAYSKHICIKHHWLSPDSLLSPEELAARDGTQVDENNAVPPLQQAVASLWNDYFTPAGPFSKTLERQHSQPAKHRERPAAAIV